MTTLTLPEMSCRYGAPLGRRSHGTLENVEPRTLRIQKVRLDSGGYDRGGAYWGSRLRGQSLYWVTDGDGYSQFADASSTARALLILGVGEYPQTLKCRRLVREMIGYVLAWIDGVAPAPNDEWTSNEALEVLHACGVAVGIRERAPA